MITKSDAERIAGEFVRDVLKKNWPQCYIHYSEDPGATLRRHGICLEADSDLCRPRWSVSFETWTDDGLLMDGPTIVIVDAESGVPQLFDEVWQKFSQSYLMSPKQKPHAP